MVGTVLSWIQNLLGFERKSGVGLTDPAAWAIFGASPTASGIAVTPATAMQVPAVRCAVQAIAETLSTLPLIIYRRGPDGSRERAPDHPASKVLNGVANPWTPSSLLIETVTRDALLHRDGGFIFINRVGGKPVELLRLCPESVSATIDQVTGEPIYKSSDSNGSRVLQRQDVLHIPSPSLTGCGLVHDARESIALALILERHVSKLFARGAKPSGILKFKRRLDPEAAARIKQSWQSAHSGESAGSTAVLEDDADFQALTLNSVDSQLLELRQFTISEIARVFRVPPILLMEFGRATWGNASAVADQFLRFTLLPWITRWEAEINLKLFGDHERDAFYAEFLSDALVRADLATRMDAYTKAIAARVLNPNEARAMENRPPYAGGDKFENPNTSAPAMKAAA